MGLVPGVDWSRAVESMDWTSRVSPAAVTVTVSVVVSLGCWSGVAGWPGRGVWAGLAGCVAAACCVVCWAGRRWVETVSNASRESVAVRVDLRRDVMLPPKIIGGPARGVRER